MVVLAVAEVWALDRTLDVVPSQVYAGRVSDLDLSLVSAVADLEAVLAQCSAAAGQIAVDVLFLVFAGI